MGGGAGIADFGADFPARAETRVHQAPILELLQRLAIFIKMIRLAAHRLLPFKAQPCQVFGDGVIVFWFYAGRVDVFDPEQKPPATF